MNRNIIKTISKMNNVYYDIKYQLIIDLCINWKMLFIQETYHQIKPINISLKNNKNILNLSSSPYIIFHIDKKLILNSINNFFMTITIHDLNIITSIE